MKKNILMIILYAVAVFSILYFIVLMQALGPAFRFNYVWLLIGLFCMGIALILSFSKKGFQWMPKPALILIECIVIAGCLLFVIVEGIIVYQSRKMPSCEADYLIVLGAKVNGTTPSRVLHYRIKKAAEYLKEYPQARVVVSGGQGEDEGISEAEAMRTGLIALGIEKERIEMEDQSTSTKENLEFSKRYLDIEEQRILIVTTDFHVFRSVMIAKKAGYKQVEGLASDSLWYLIPTNYVREFMAVVKDKLAGNI